MGAPAVASYPGVTLRTVYAIIDEGQLPAFKIRRVIRVRREARLRQDLGLPDGPQRCDLHVVSRLRFPGRNVVTTRCLTRYL